MMKSESDLSLKSVVSSNDQREKLMSTDSTNKSYQSGINRLFNDTNASDESITTVNKICDRFCPCFVISCCCFGCNDDECARWLFFHTGPAQINNSTEGYKAYCKCLDCCSWCFELKYKMNCCCKERTICFLFCGSCTFD